MSTLRFDPSAILAAGPAILAAKPGDSISSVLGLGNGLSIDDARNIFIGDLFCNAKDKGAVGDGTTDDTDALLDAAATGKHLLIPPTGDTYKLSERINVGNQSVFGHGRLSRIVQTGSDGNGECFRFTGQEYCGVYNCHLTPGETPHTTNGFAISFVQCEGCFALLNEITNHHNGIGAIDSSNCLIAYNHLHDSSHWTDKEYHSAADIYLINESSGHQVIHNRCINGAGMGVALMTLTYPGVPRVVQDNLIQGNRVDGQTQHGICLYTTSTNDTWRNNRVDANTVRNITGEMPNVTDSDSLSFGIGIYVQGTAGTTVSDNDVSDTCLSTAKELLAPAGIGVLNTRDVAVIGNRVRASSWYGIMIADPGVLGVVTDHPSIADNHVDGCTKHNILIKDIPYVQIEGGSSLRSGQTGLSYTQTGSSATAIKIVGGAYSGNTGHGISVTVGEFAAEGVSADQNGSGGISVSTPSATTLNGCLLRRNAINLRVETGAGSVGLRGSLLSSPLTQNVLNNSGHGIRGLANNTFVNPAYPFSTSDLFFAMADSATPSVAGAELAKTGGTTAITGFTGGVAGQQVLLRADHSVTITHGDSLKLAGSANFAMTAGDLLTLFLDGTVWREIGRVEL